MENALIVGALMMGWEALLSGSENRRLAQVLVMPAQSVGKRRFNAVRMLATARDAAEEVSEPVHCSIIP